MHSLPSTVEEFYTRNDLFDAIVKALEKKGISRRQVTRNDIAGIDEFHVRGQEVSRQLAAQAGIQPGMRVLDVGCGLGGACRMLADEFRCIVAGIDITQEYVRTAQQLSVLTGWQQQTHFVHASALDLPFADGYFDIVWTQHVQMNIADKETLYAEIKRVLKNDGRFIYYDILSQNKAPLHFPVPWADDPSLGFLITAPRLHQLLQHGGWEPVLVTDETQQGIAFLNNLLNRAAQQGLPEPGLQLLMGDTTLEKLGNLYTNLAEERVMLESGIYRKRNECRSERIHLKNEDTDG